MCAVRGFQGRSIHRMPTSRASRLVQIADVRNVGMCYIPTDGAWWDHRPETQGILLVVKSLASGLLHRRTASISEAGAGVSLRANLVSCGAGDVGDSTGRYRTAKRGNCQQSFWRVQAASLMATAFSCKAQTRHPIRGSSSHALKKARVGSLLLGQCVKAVQAEGSPFPCKTNKLAREIPSCRWCAICFLYACSRQAVPCPRYQSPVTQFFASGFLPFSSALIPSRACLPNELSMQRETLVAVGAIYIELHYIFNSVRLTCLHEKISQHRQEVSSHTWRLCIELANRFGGLGYTSSTARASRCMGAAHVTAENGCLEH